MDASENGAAAPEKRDDAESFTKVKSKKSQKRKLEPDGGTMEVEEPNKRPHFPPISADKLRVFITCLHLPCRVKCQPEAVLTRLFFQSSVPLNLVMLCACAQ